MPTEITKKEANGFTILSIRGEMCIDDAIILRRLVNDLAANDGQPIIVDIAGLAFIDSESAPILREIADLPRVTIEGTDSLIQTAINLVEKRIR